MEYWAFIVVYNLLPDDYRKVGEIKRVVNDSIVEGVPGRQGEGARILFSFPQDPTVNVASIPVVVDISLLKSLTGTDSFDWWDRHVYTKFREILNNRAEIHIVRR